ncbi:MAG: TetR/AcrR family transcriptional regulator [Saprospiraceae bacterium]|nr:TetR/AcrR family transcriptional regulator [Candidatus Parvibacillus calidus]MBX2937378.1 TetR/AcrR family transcriptional regulator [Saprospiraceae bacterium]MBX7179200.1 TetR/AcrR family transcriptional regulator [Saprospiraceae bacterium]MCC7149782.1 TetR/AcrR family transcriptional regulator [Saprospiraceae bacterium]MCO6470433.1 TetR/AcrR family transcriptional regulator [Saprospiraceae bacterium]
MVKKRENMLLDNSTEEKIKESARKVFLKKGYAATRTRDIAEGAGINLALLNYYFRSKEKLFELIMLETMFSFMQKMAVVLNDEDSKLEKKVELIASNYIDFFTEEPNVPIFVLNEMHKNPRLLFDTLPVRELFFNSVFFRQYQTQVAKGKIKEGNPANFLINMMSLIIFPFVGSPIFKLITGTLDVQYLELMQERKKLIPRWVKAMMKSM